MKHLLTQIKQLEWLKNVFKEIEYCINYFIGPTAPLKDD